MLPEQVRNAIMAAEYSLSIHHEHALRPLDRKLIYEAIASAPSGDQVRAWLDVITAEHVLPIWLDARPSDLLPQFVLKEAKDFLQSNKAQVAVRAKAAEMGDHLEKLVDWANEQAKERYRVWYAGEATAEAAHLATDGERWTESWPIINGTLTDEWLDALYSDTAKWASFAYAGRATDSNFEPQKRLQFWAFWLTEAIPEAFRAERKA